MSDFLMAIAQAGQRADDDAQVPTLDLLSPWALAAELPLAAEHRAPVRRALNGLLRALDTPPADAQAALELALAGLPDERTRPLDMRATDTPLSPEEVQDYDRYFGLRHVDSDAPGLCLVRSLLVMSRAFIALCASTDGLDGEAMAMQKDGLRCQIALIARVLALDLEGAD